MRQHIIQKGAEEDFRCANTKSFQVWLKINIEKKRLMFGGENADELIMDVNDKWWTGEEQQRQKKNNQ